jgi:hypothetical protein
MIGPGGISVANGKGLIALVKTLWALGGIGTEKCKPNRPGLQPTDEPPSSHRVRHIVWPPVVIVVVANHPDTAVIDKALIEMEIAPLRVGRDRDLQV